MKFLLVVAIFGCVAVLMTQAADDESNFSSIRECKSKFLAAKRNIVVALKKEIYNCTKEHRNPEHCIAAAEGKAKAAIDKKAEQLEDCIRGAVAPMMTKASKEECKRKYAQEIFDIKIELGRDIVHCKANHANPDECIVNAKAKAGKASALVFKKIEECIAGN